ncbi:electron transport complex subunit RsxD [Candidatus Albibeggiatoa sp. nov. NOAA]|uniref:electron transport complex subunit RsxD n=1 Tax=Candidatus Albibeggiatoa sp. nov. NOAA TaxID=3162724 RepID=UPI0032F86DA2|nr:electron transport complex subunit RsxD [Thiotrichaceae bacterium]
MQFKVTYSPHIHSGKRVNQVMYQVLLALLPGIATYIWFFGWGIAINILLACITALGFEAVMLWLRKRPIQPFIMDGSAVLTGCLFALATTPFLPWWMTVLGIGFGMVFAKHLYGGLGNNPFNPAMVSYVVLLVSFPAEMTQWPSYAAITQQGGLSFWDSFNIIFASQPTALPLDAITSATPLDDVKTSLGQFIAMHEIMQSTLYGTFAGKAWEWIAAAYLLGGLWLIYIKVIDWRIPTAVLTGLFVMSLVFNLVDNDIYAPPLFHIFSGAAILGAFFIATDPVTAATSVKGRWIFGLGIGGLVYIIRTWGGYPDGVAFAVLLMNLAVPTIDYVTKPKVFGARS